MLYEVITLQEEKQIRIFAENEGIDPARYKYFVPYFPLFFIFFSNRYDFKLPLKR